MKEKYMLIAIAEAEKALKLGEVPVGAVIVKDDNIISKAYNKKEKNQMVTSHAEILAIEKASKKLKNWRLEDCELYVTLEPCPMCASAIKQSRIKKIYYGLSNSDKNNRKIIELILQKDYVNPEVQINNGYFSKQINKLLSNFFRDIRK